MKNILNSKLIFLLVALKGWFESTWTPPPTTPLDPNQASCNKSVIYVNKLVKPPNNLIIKGLNLQKNPFRNKINTF